jgi:hypothetical protein
MRRIATILLLLCGLLVILFILFMLQIGRLLPTSTPMPPTSAMDAENTGIAQMTAFADMIKQTYAAIASMTRTPTADSLIGGAYRIWTKTACMRDHFYAC